MGDIEKEIHILAEMENENIIYLHQVFVFGFDQNSNADIWKQVLLADDDHFDHTQVYENEDHENP